ncbi:MAG: hypothetical protein JWN67_56 [Actinomycetia bacterium]|nr:hypothetical protein [Actinomycetes bacterium]
MRSDALRRVVATSGVDDLVDVLARLPGADLTTLLLAVTERRAGDLAPADVLRQATTDRFVQPASIDGRALHDLEVRVLAALPTAFEAVVLSPLSPLGTHSTLATVSQHKVVTTVRRTDVAADPTNALAIEAARRRAGQRSGALRLAAIQRVVRAQQGEGTAHFGLCGLVTAGRTSGQHRFEAAALTEHVQAIVDLATAGGATDLEVAITDLGVGLTPTVRGATVRDDPSRTSGRGYYRDVCFKVQGVVAGQRRELADGGATDWTARLLGDRKERLFISGLGLDRLLG